MRGALRSALWALHRHDLGCPRDGFCQLRKAFDQKVECGAALGCKHFLTPEEPPPDPTAMGRIRWLVRLESMVNVGCKFGPDDLSPRVWDELIVLAQERQRMDERVRKARDRQHQGEGPGLDRAAQQKLAEARKLDKIPPPGGSIFPRRGAR